MTTRKAAAPAPKRPSAFMRGDAGRSNTDTEIALGKQKAEQRKANANKPFRFYVPIGETRRIIICDDTPDFFLYEHGLKDADGKWGRLFTGCVKTFDNCPVCEATSRESYYAMILTIIDLTPFQNRDGDTIEFSRKLLVVKPAQQKKFLRFYAKEGSLRGAMFDMTRDGDKDPSIGNDIEFVEFVEEDELATFHRSWKDKEGKKHEEDCDEVYIYEELFEEPTTENLRAIVGGQPAAGSREADNRALGGGRQSTRRSRDADDWSDADDSKAYEGKPKGRGRAAPEPEEEEEEEEPAPRRGRAAPAPAAKGRGRAAPEPEEEEEEEEPAPRRGRAAPAPAAKGRGRAAPEPEEEEEEEEEPAPRRGRTAPAPAAKAPATRGRAKPEPEEEEEEEEDELPFEEEDRKGARTTRKGTSAPAPTRGRARPEPEPTPRGRRR